LFFFHHIVAKSSGFTAKSLNVMVDMSRELSRKTLHCSFAQR